MDSNTKESVSLLVECVIFVRKWLCWRKWLRVTGLFEWGLSGLQVYNDDGDTQAVYRYETSWHKYFLTLAKQSQMRFNHFPVGAECQNVTGTQIRHWMIREQQMIAIEREWCRINSQAIVTNNHFKAVLNRCSSTAHEAIDNATMVLFCRQICCRLAQLTQSRLLSSTVKSLEKKSNQWCCLFGEAASDPTWTMDSLVHTFDDNTISLMLEVMAHCTLISDPSDDDNQPLGLSSWCFDPTINNHLWLTIPVKLSPQNLSIRVNLDTKEMIIGPSDQADNGQAVNIKLSTVRILLNPHIIPQEIGLLNPAIKANQYRYGTVLMQLIDNYHHRCQQTDSPLTCQNELNNLIKIVQLKNIARVLVTYSQSRQSKTIIPRAQQDKQFFLFPNNGIDHHSVIAEVMLLLFGADQPEMVMDINRYTMHDKVVLKEGVPFDQAIAAYRKKIALLIGDDSPPGRCFSLWVTSLLFDAQQLKRAQTGLEPSSRINLDSQRGFYLRHDKYPQVMMIFLPANQIPQCDRQWQCDDHLGLLIGEPPEDPTRGFFRLVLVRREGVAGGQMTSSVPAINLDDPLVLCQLLRDIVHYFDPQAMLVNQLFRIDPFLSNYLDTRDQSSCQLGLIDQNRKRSEKKTIRPITYSNITFWQLLRDKIPQKKALVRSSPTYYGPELTCQGINQQCRGVVPFEINTANDSWKFYIYDDPQSKTVRNKQQPTEQTNIVCTGDKVSQHWLVMESKTVALHALSRTPPIVRLINWYDDHYPGGQPSVKKVISKRIYLINDLIAFCENPTKLIGGSRGSLTKVDKIYHRNFANYCNLEDNKGISICQAQQPAKSDNHHSGHFIDVVYQAMWANNINYHKKNNRVALNFYETPSFFVLFFQCTHFWFPKWSIDHQMYRSETVPSHLVPLIQWVIDQRQH